MKKVLSLPLFLLLFSSGLFAQSISGTSLEADRSNEFLQNDGTVPAPTDRVTVFIPNAFTPNDDGVNDFFYIPQNNLTQVEISVLDRWGNQVFQSNAQNFRWDGNSKGRQLPTGVYVFVFRGTAPNGDKIKRSGTISLVR